MTGRGDTIRTKSTKQAGVTNVTTEGECVVIRSAQHSGSSGSSSREGIGTSSKADNTAKAAAEDHSVITGAAIKLTSDHVTTDAHEISAGAGIHRAVRHRTDHRQGVSQIRSVLRIADTRHAHQCTVEGTAHNHAVGTQLATNLATIHSTQADGVVAFAASYQRSTGCAVDSDRIGARVALHIAADHISNDAQHVIAFAAIDRAAGCCSTHQHTVSALVAVNLSSKQVASNRDRVGTGCAGNRAVAQHRDAQRIISCTSSNRTASHRQSCNHGVATTSSNNGAAG